MTTTLPTEQEIRAMDGPALTRLAYMLGLAPEWVHWNDAWEGDVPGPCGIDRWGIISPYTMSWHPHDDLTQAREVFLDKMMEFSFVTTYEKFSANYGFCHAKWRPKRLGNYRDRIRIAWHPENGGLGLQISEAYALLLCACLARAAQMREATS